MATRPNVMEETYWLMWGMKGNWGKRNQVVVCVESDGLVWSESGDGGFRRGQIAQMMIRKSCLEIQSIQKI